MIRRKKQSLAPQVPKRDVSFQPESFVLCERSSGALRFRVQADPDGGMPVEQVAGLLAMHCLVRGQAPEDFEVMVVARKSMLQAVSQRAEQLLAAGRSIGSGVKISRREQEVLDGVLQGLANKEIANTLNVSERTVKFHVSSLLAKYGVTDRIALSREVSLGRVPADNLPGRTPTLFGYPVRGRDGKDHQPRAEDPPAAAVQGSNARNAVFPIFPRQRYAT